MGCEIFLPIAELLQLRYTFCNALTNMMAQG